LKTESDVLFSAMSAAIQGYFQGKNFQNFKNTNIIQIKPNKEKQQVHLKTN